MATYLSGNVRKATANTCTAMRNSAKRRECPSCLRRSALKSLRERQGNTLVVIEWCRWSETVSSDGYRYCDYRNERRIGMTE